jgi:hypothetical protein
MKCVFRLSLTQLSFSFLTHLSTVFLSCCLLFVLGYGWKRLDFDNGSSQWRVTFAVEEMGSVDG